MIFLALNGAMSSSGTPADPGERATTRAPRHRFSSPDRRRHAVRRRARRPRVGAGGKLTPLRRRLKIDPLGGGGGVRGSTRWRWAPTASMTATCCARDARAGCWAAGCRPPRRWARSCARLPSARCASLIACWPRRWGGRGRPARDRATADWSSTSTASSARCTATTSTARRSATPAGAATTPCWPRGPTPARSCSPYAKGSANTARGALRFVEELIARVTRAGATGSKLFRADSGFWNKKLIARLQKAGWQYSIGVLMQAWVPDAIARIPEGDWQPLEDYPDDGEAQIAQTMVGPQRLVVRRTRLVAPQAELWPDWRYFAFITNRTEALEVVEAEHRQHAVVELAIRDLKDQALAHFPSGKFNANAAWTVIGCVAHNLLRWTTLIGLPGQTVRAAHPAPPAARDSRPTDAQRSPVDAAPPRSLALATRLRPGARTHPSAARRGLTGPAPLDHQPGARADTGARRLRANTPDDACTQTPAAPQRRSRGPSLRRRPTPPSSAPVRQRRGGSRLSSDAFRRWARLALRARRAGPPGSRSLAPWRGGSRRTGAQGPRGCRGALDSTPDR
jgi:DDE family transposase